MLKRLGVQPVEVRLPSQMQELNCVIMPGGESTTFAKLAVRFDLVEPLRKFIRDGKPA